MNHKVARLLRHVDEVVFLTNPTAASQAKPSQAKPI
jgi:hypothetical protein